MSTVNFTKEEYERVYWYVYGEPDEKPDRLDLGRILNSAEVAFVMDLINKRDRQREEIHEAVADEERITWNDVREMSELFEEPQHNTQFDGFRYLSGPEKDPKPEGEYQQLLWTGMKWNDYRHDSGPDDTLDYLNRLEAMEARLRLSLLRWTLAFGVATVSFIVTLIWLIKTRG